MIHLYCYLRARLSEKEASQSLSEPCSRYHSGLHTVVTAPGSTRQTSDTGCLWCNGELRCGVEMVFHQRCSTGNNEVADSQLAGESGGYKQHVKEVKHYQRLTLQAKQIDLFSEHPQGSFHYD